MSRIYFHTKTDEAEVRGTERYFMGRVLSDMGVSPLLPLCRAFLGDVPAILKHLPKDHYLIKEVWENRPENFESAFMTWFRVSSSDDDVLIINGREHNIWTLMLNTGIAAGSDPIKLYAYIHGLSEIHGYVEGWYRKWLAGIIEDGLATSIYRPDMGWESVISLLLSETKSPVVMSYSVCEQFPNSTAANFYSDDEDAWDKLSKDKQWELGMTELRKNYGLCLRPDHWNNNYFDTLMNSFDAALEIERCRYEKKLNMK